MKRRKEWLPVLALVGAMLACNFPVGGAPTAGPSPVDLTVTALFSTAQAKPATATITLRPPVLTATSGPATATQAAPPPSATAAPTIVVNTLPPPTATQRPAPTARPGPAWEAAFLDPAPVIDGNLTDLRGRATEVKVTDVVYGKSEWTGPNDLSATFYLGWNATYLFIGAEVKDDRYVQVASGKNLFKGDSLEVLVDTNLRGDYFVDALNDDDNQIGISPGRNGIGGETEAYRWYPAGVAGSLSSVKIASSGGDGSYVVEAAIPWSSLGVSAASGLRLGFGFSVSDDDQPGEALQQSMISSLPERVFVDPSTWGTLWLK